MGEAIDRRQRIVSRDVRDLLGHVVLLGRVLARLVGQPLDLT